MVMSIGWNPYYKNEVRSVVCTSWLRILLSMHALLWDEREPLMQMECMMLICCDGFKEVHIMHAFHHNFYGARMNLLICGFIRPEYDYVSKESLIEDINVDIEVAKRSLEREAYLKVKEEKYLLEFGGEGHEGEVAS